MEAGLVTTPKRLPSWPPGKTESGEMVSARLAASRDRLRAQIAATERPPLAKTKAESRRRDAREEQYAAFVRGFNACCVPGERERGIRWVAGELGVSPRHLRDLLANARGGHGEYGLMLPEPGRSVYKLAISEEGERIEDELPADSKRCA